MINIGKTGHGWNLGWVIYILLLGGSFGFAAKPHPNRDLGLVAVLLWISAVTLFARDISHPASRRRKEAWSGIVAGVLVCGAWFVPLAPWDKSIIKESPHTTGGRAD